MAVGLVAAGFASASAVAQAGSRDAATVQTQAAWVERGPGRSVVVRAISATGQCPRATINGKSRPMFAHASPIAPDFPVTVCERRALLPADGIRVGGTKLRSPPLDPSRIVVVGDTGCRMAAPNHFQACNDYQQWPWAQVAQSIAAWRPQLIIHVGDYLYRESPCPSGNAGCAGSPYGDNWPTWNADFFTPAAPALQAAPWVFMRGNHEDCDREAGGWFRFLDPRPMPTACTDMTPPYAIRLARLKLLMLDSSGASDFSPFNPQPYAPQFAALNQMAGKRKAWFLTHRPLWGLAAISNGTKVAVTNETLQLASGNTLSPQVQMVLSGHLHNFEVFSFTGGRPPQIVSGEGGTQEDAQITAPVLGTNVAGQTITSSQILSRFGFMTFTRQRQGWIGTARDIYGSPLFQCRIAGGAAPC